MEQTSPATVDAPLIRLAKKKADGRFGGRFGQIGAPGRSYTEQWAGPGLIIVTAGSVQLPGRYGAADGLHMVAAVTAVGGTTPSLQFFVEDSLDGGVNWNAVVQSAAITANGVYVVNTNINVVETATLKPIWGDVLRLRWTMTGTTPTATVDVRAQVK